MKTRIKFLTVLLIAFLCCFMTACDKNIYYWEIAQDIRNISKVEIVDIDIDYNMPVIFEIEPKYYEDVVNDVQTLPARKYIGSLASSYGKSVKITFMDGTYDIISEYEPKHIVEPELGLAYARNRHYYYDTEDFNRLIEKWTNM